MAVSYKREFLFKTMVIGETFTGKTPLVKRYEGRPYSDPSMNTIGVNFALKMVKYDADTIIRVQLWDMAGSERFGELTHLWFREAVGCSIVFDLTRHSTFEAVTTWKTILDREVRLPNGDPIPCILIGNKCDLDTADSEFSPERLDDFCREQGFVKWFKTSGKENINVQESFQFLLDEIMKLPEELVQSCSSDASTTQIINITTGPISKRNNNSSCYCGSTSS